VLLNLLQLPKIGTTVSLLLLQSLLQNLLLLPKIRDDRQPTPTPKSTPAPAPRNDGPSAAEKALADSKAKALADKAVRDQIESDRAAQLARDQKLLSEKNAARLAALDVNPVYAELKTGVKKTDETQTAPVFTPNILDAQTDDDLGLTSSPLAGTAGTGATNTGVDTVKTNVPFKGTMKNGVLVDRLGNPVVTNAKGYGYLDPLTGLAVTPWTDSDKRWWPRFWRRCIWFRWGGGS
jgi:hypothetical protein